MSASMREAQAADWLDDLREFTPAIVEEACRRWRRANPDRRPGPGHIRALCLEERREHQEATRLKALPSSRRMSRHEPTIYEDREARAAANRWAQQRGHVDFDAYLKAGGSVTQACRAIIGADEEVPGRKLAKRWEFTPSSERLAAGRQALIDKGYLPKDEDGA